MTVRPSPQKVGSVLISSLPALEKAETSRVFPFLALYRSVESMQDFRKSKYLSSWYLRILLSVIKGVERSRYAESRVAGVSGEIVVGILADL